MGDCLREKLEESGFKPWDFTPNINPLSLCIKNAEVFENVKSKLGGFVIVPMIAIATTEHYNHFGKSLKELSVIYHRDI